MPLQVCLQGLVATLIDWLHSLGGENKVGSVCMCDCVTCGHGFLSGLLLGRAPLFFWEFWNRKRALWVKMEGILRFDLIQWYRNTSCGFNCLDLMFATICLSKPELFEFLNGKTSMFLLLSPETRAVWSITKLNAATNHPVIHPVWADSVIPAARRWYMQVPAHKICAATCSSARWQCNYGSAVILSEQQFLRRLWNAPPPYATL